MTDPTPLNVAEARAARAKRRLGATVGALQSRLDLRTVARDAVDGLTDTGEKALRGGVDAAIRHPGRVAGALALAAALLGRRRIAALVGKSRPDRNEAAQPVVAPARSTTDSLPIPARRKTR